MTTETKSQPPKVTQQLLAKPEPSLGKLDPLQKNIVPKKRTVLRFSPTAWAKLLFFRDRGHTEIGGFGITDADDLLYVQDFQTVRQDVTLASVSFDDDAVSEFFDRQVDAGRQPVQFGRVWCHTHPGNSPTPSSIDEETFERVFRGCQHAVMFIMAQDGKTYARLRFNVGPSGDLIIPVEVDYCEPFGGSDKDAWEEEYKANIQTLDWNNWGRLSNDHPAQGLLTQGAHRNLCVPDDWLDQLEQMDTAERSQILDELAGREDLWAEAGYYP